MALAALFAALARTLGEQDESFLSRLSANLEQTYRQLEDKDEPLAAMEALRWADTLIRS
jgi:putative NADPH-quinone reductase